MQKLFHPLFDLCHHLEGKNEMPVNLSAVYNFNCTSEVVWSQSSEPALLLGL